MVSELAGTTACCPTTINYWTISLTIIDQLHCIIAIKNCCNWASAIDHICTQTLRQKQPKSCIWYSWSIVAIRGIDSRLRYWIEAQSFGGLEGLRSGGQTNFFLFVLGSTAYQSGRAKPINQIVQGQCFYSTFVPLRRWDPGSNRWESCKSHWSGLAASSRQHFSFFPEQNQQGDWKT